MSPVYRERRAKLICFAGGMCERCGLMYDGKNGSVFVFHHVAKNDTQKLFQLTVANMGKDWDTLKGEVLKSELLCHNCHSMEHSEKY